MSKRCLLLVSSASAFLACAPATMADTGTVFLCKVTGEADVQVYIDAQSTTVAVEQKGQTSLDARGTGGRFKLDFQDGTFEFVLSGTDHTGTMAITRNKVVRRGTCS